MSRRAVNLPSRWPITRVVVTLGEKVLFDQPAGSLMGPGGSRVMLPGGVVLFFDTTQLPPSRRDWRRAAGAAIAGACGFLRNAGPVIASWATVAACCKYLLGA